MALGQVLKDNKGLRHRIVIQSKCGERFRDGGSADNSREHILQSVHGSLRRMGIEYLDILLLHFPDSLVEPEEVAQAFDELKRDGKVRYFGVSNHGSIQIQLLQKYVREPLVANQIQLGLVIMERPAPDSQSAGYAVNRERLAAQSRIRMGAGDEERTIYRAGCPCSDHCRSGGRSGR